MYVATWRTRDGKTLRLDQMDTTHVRNCIAKIERHYAHGQLWRIAFLEPLRFELYVRTMEGR